MQLNEAVKEAIKILSEIRSGNMTPIAEEAWKSAIKILEDGLQLTQQKSDTQQKSATHLPCCGYEDTSAIKWNPYNSVVQCHNCGQVYAAHNQARQPLTDEQIKSAVRRLYGSDAVAAMAVTGDIETARAVEAAHGIK